MCAVNVMVKVVVSRGKLTHRKRHGKMAKGGVKVKKNRWATASGKVVSVRLTEVDYNLVVRHASSRKMLVGKYLRWLIRNTSDDGYDLRVRRMGSPPWE